MIALLFASAMVIEEPQVDNFFGSTPEELTCIVIMNYFENKVGAYNLGKKVDLRVSDTEKANLFSSTGFTSISDFAMKMSLDEAKYIIYSSSDSNDTELRKIEEQCKRTFLK